MSEDEGVKTTSWDGYLKEGPGAVTTAVPIIEVDGHGGHVLEAEYKRMPIGPDHILYPVMISLALFPILMGASGHHLADDMPEENTHPFFPDHFWPYHEIVGRLPARRRGWASWPVPGRNKITGTGWIVFLGILLFLTFWSLSGIT